ncbi:MAG: hypothetical protein JXR63_01280 [Spirochaetales bacterium]|nr:hypothetical protein [Spirochaetales bacterium]
MKRTIFFLSFFFLLNNLFADYEILLNLDEGDIFYSVNETNANVDTTMFGESTSVETYNLNISKLTVLSSKMGVFRIKSELVYADSSDFAGQNIMDDLSLLLGRISYEFSVDKNGAISDLVVLGDRESFNAELSSIVAGLFSEGEDATDQLEVVKNTYLNFFDNLLDDKTILENLEASFAYLPKKKVALGDTWNSSLTQDFSGMLATLSNDYTLKSVDDSNIYLDSLVRLDFDLDEYLQSMIASFGEGFTGSVDVDASGICTYVIDKNTGYPLSSSLNLKASFMYSFEGEGFSFTMPMSMVITEKVSTYKVLPEEYLKYLSQE